MVWDEETIRSLQDLWTQGLSTAEIGRRLGVSKNAIVGKAHRLDLEARPSPIRRGVAKPVNERPAAFPRMAGPTLPPLASAVVESFDSQALPVSVFVPPAFATTVVATTVLATTALATTGLAQPVAVQPASVTTVVVPPAVTASSNAVPSNVQPLRPAPVVAVRPATPPTVQAPAAPRPMMPSAPIQTRRSTPSCCWPIGEPGTKAFRFCDDNSLPGKPYCDEHARLAYVRIRDRKEDAA